MKKALLSSIYLLLCSFMLGADDVYPVYLPAGSTVKVKIPTVCLQYEKRMPAPKDSFSTSVVLVDREYYLVLLRVKEELVENYLDYMDVFITDYASIKGENSKTDKILAHAFSLAEEMNRINPEKASLNELMHSLELSRQYLELIEKSTNVTMEPGEKLPGVTRLEKIAIYKRCCENALQRACWLESETYKKKYQASTNLNIHESTLFALANLMRELADTIVKKTKK
jgi:hypothetical protein